MDHADVLTEQHAPQNREELRQQIEAQIRHLERSAGHGLWGMVIFLLVSVAAFDDFSILPDLPEHVRRLLGAPPPVEMISLGLVIYAFAGIVHILARMTRNVPSYRGLMHAGFLVVFYGFYHFSGYLPDNFWAVFFAGLSVLGLENFAIWNQCSAAIRREKEKLAKLDKGLPFYRENDTEGTAK